ncbi:MAG: hypothetical protein OEZ34_09635 [Spirochaetia bacterium]|nr:hypothetical protein [Spirochaetia bacterium]
MQTEGWNWEMDLGLKQYDEDYYLQINPLIQFELFSLRVGLQLPLEILAYDKDPKSDQKEGSLRTGTFNSKEDYIKVIKYIGYGSHLYFDPDDLFNWSFHYGFMTNGYIGHKTIVNRYVTTHNPSEYFRSGFMADLNNRWGGFEVFRSDVMRNEVTATRGYVRPIGVLKTIRNVFFAHNSFSTNQRVAMSILENRNPDFNGGIFFQEASLSDEKSGGSLQQYLHNKIKDDVPLDGDSPSARDRHGKIGDIPSDSDKVEYRKVKDPVTGREKMIPVDKDPVASEREASSDAQRQHHRDKDYRSEEQKKEDRKKWEPGFFNRWAIGYTIARDTNAPKTLEKDGSGNLVMDPETGRPRGATFENINIVGMDTEFRMSPFRWLELTPYADLNKIKNASESEGLHVGIDAGFKIGSLIKFTFRPEYREFTENYIPSYFDSYYVIERSSYNPGGSGDGSGTSATTSKTKLEYLKSLGHGGPKIKGTQIHMIFDIVNFFVIEVTYDDYDGPDNSQMFTGVYLPPLFGIFFMNGYYLKKGFNHIKESYIKDDRSLIAAEAGLILFGGFTVKGTLRRTWVYDNASSSYLIQDEKEVSFGYNSNF